MELQSLLQPVIDIAQTSGRRVLAIYQQGDFEQKLKTDYTPVTSADLESHQILMQRLSALTPGIPVLSEEDADIPFTEREKWSCYWLVDPLDGTQEFICGSGEFATAIALVCEHKPVLGVVYRPLTDTTYCAIKNNGAWKIESDAKRQPLSVLKHDEQDHHLSVVISRRQNHTKTINRFAKDWHCDFVHLGSAALKSCLVAEGGVDCYLRLGPTGEWDTAAIQCIVEEAGGAVVDLFGQPLSYNQRESLINPNFLVMGDVNLPWRDIVQFEQPN